MVNEPENKKVLVVEDDVSLRSVLRDMLILEHFAVLEAKDGEEGLAIALHEHPDLILLDILMPKMDGVTMLQKVREDAWGKKVQVVVLTNVSSNEQIAEMMDNEVFEYLIKSDIKLEDLVAKIKEKLGA